MIGPSAPASLSACASASSSQLPLSSRTTLAPVRDSASLSVTPAGPPPTTQTSARSTAALSGRGALDRLRTPVSWAPPAQPRRTTLTDRHAAESVYLEIRPVGPAVAGLAVVLHDVAKPAVHTHREDHQASVAVLEDTRRPADRVPEVTPLGPAHLPLAPLLPDVTEPAISAAGEHLEQPGVVLEDHWRTSDGMTEPR